MKIQEKKLRTWGTVVLLLAILSILIFAFRVEAKLDLLNNILLDLTMVFGLAGAVLRLIESTKILIRARQIVKNGGQISIGV